MRRLAGVLLLAAYPAAADIYTPTRVIRAKEVIGPGDVVRHVSDMAGPDAVIGLEARLTLYPNQPIRTGDVGPPAIVERNQVVTLTFATGGLRIATDGRVLDRGAAGDMVRVINLSSRTSVSGRVHENGWIEVE